MKKRKPQIPTVSKSLIKPLNRFQKSLMNRGYKEEPSKFKEFIAKKSIFIETIAVILITLYALIFNPYYLLILPAIGAAVFYRTHVKFIWWWVKVFILYRKYYEDRRILYKQGSLYYHFQHKRPKKFRNGLIVVWAQSPHLQQYKFNRLQKQNKLINKKEYIL